MCRKKYKITLTAEERRILRTLNSNPHRSKITRKRALLLIALDESNSRCVLSDEQAAGLFDLRPGAVQQLRKLFVEEGFETALHGRPRNHCRVPRKIDGEMEARLVQLACSKPPAGFATWSLRLLTSRFVELVYPEGVSTETVRRTLKKTNLSLGKRSIS